MTARMKSLGIDRLSRDEQIELVHEICDHIDAEPLNDDQKCEVDRRLSAFAANPTTAVPWEVVEAEALARIRK